jgi:hypothetical protein
MFDSCSCPSFSRSVMSLLYRNFTVMYLCCVGWLEVYGMMVSVKVGFLYMEVFMSVGGFCVWICQASLEWCLFPKQKETTL